MNKVKNPIPMLVILCIGAFTASFSENIINVALSDIVSEFSIGTVTAQWLVTGYMIVASIMNASAAFLVTRFKVKKLFSAAGLFFTFGLVAAFFAPNFPLLLLFRLVQAIGTGIFIPLMVVSVLALAPKEKLGTFMAVANCCITLGPAFGPAIAGFMVSFFGWRYVFVPLAIVMVATLIAGQFVLQDFNELTISKFDIFSGVLAALGLTCLVFGLSQIASVSVPGIMSLIFGCIILILFAKRQLKLEQPFLDVKPLFNSTYLLYSIISIVEMMISFSLSVLLPLYYQGPLYLSAMIVGIFILIPILINSASALIAGKVMDKYGVWPLVPVGFVVTVVGMIGIFTLSTTMNELVILLSSCVVFFGLGLFVAPAQTHALSKLDKKMQPSGASLASVFVMAAGALGPSLFVGIMNAQANVQMSAGTAYEMAEALGFSQAIFVATIVAAIGLIVSLLFTKEFWVKKKIVEQSLEHI